MLRNYFKIAWRNLIKNKVSSFINVAGLATGMAVALLIGLWIWDELSFDHYHQNHDSLAQVMDTQTFNGETNTSEAIAIPLAEELRNHYASNFKRMALVFPNFTHILAVGDKKLSQPGVWAQPDLPGMLSLQMLKGKRDALKDPSSVLLNQSLAKALFGGADPMNKIIKLDNRMEVKVAGVFKDLPQNTTFYDTKLFLSWDKAVSTLSWVKDAQTQWDSRYWKLFVQLNDKVNIDKANTKIKNVVKEHINAGSEELFLHPMNKWHLYSEFKNGKVSGGRIRYVWMFGTIGLFVLLLACINFMNLSTARSEKRAKEVGIRKAIGSLRRQLIKQFLIESLLVASLALVLSVILAQLSLPYFNRLTDKTITVPSSDPAFLLFILGFTLITGFISGSYPAFYLSAFEPVKVLNGTFRLGRWVSTPRKVLVVVQFTVSIALIIGTAIVYRQIQYAKSRPVGYTHEGLITITMNTPELFGAQYNSVRNDLIKTGAVKDMAESSVPSTKAPNSDRNFEWRGKDPGSMPLLGTVGVTHDFGRTLGWKIKEGRDFSRSFATDSGSIILNESAAKLIGLTNPVGEIIKWNGTPHIITGIVRDMVMESPYKPVQPTIFFLEYSWASFITLRINPAMPIHKALAKIKAVFKQYNPGGPFEYQFADEEYS
ncbi:MAG: ABC transporter permease, partial [Daejeonella sp.]